MTTLDESTIVTQPTLESSEDHLVRPEAQAWQLGILTDSAGHVHVGAIVAGTQFRPREYLDLLTPIGACSVRDLDLQQLVVLVHDEQVDDVRRLAERCIEDERLRNRLAALLDLSARGDSASRHRTR
jgi:hypothetical protein